MKGLKLHLFDGERHEVERGLTSLPRTCTEILQKADQVESAGKLPRRGLELC